MFSAGLVQLLVKYSRAKYIRYDRLIPHSTGFIKKDSSIINK